MSTPARPLSDPRNDRDPVHYPDAPIRCCGGNSAVPAWAILAPAFLFQSPAVAKENARQILLAHGANPDEPYCRECATGLETLRDNFLAGFPGFLHLVASIAALIPGIGSGIATVVGTAASLAEGKPLSQAAVDGVLSAVPGGPVWGVAGAAAGSILKGERIDQAALAAAREGARQEGGDTAAAAFDGIVAVAQGKSLQDAGFAGLKSLAKGNDLAERAAFYAEHIAQAAEQGKPVDEVLVSSLASDVAKAAGPGAAALIDSAVSRIQANPSLLAAGSDALGTALGVAEPIARAAQAIMRTGTPDTALRESLLPPVALGRIESAAERSTNDALEAQGYAIALSSPDVFKQRSLGSSVDYRRGFDIGTAVARRLSGPSTAQDTALARLHTVGGRAGFLMAQRQQWAQTAKLAASIATVLKGQTSTTLAPSPLIALLKAQLPPKAAAAPMAAAPVATVQAPAVAPVAPAPSNVARDVAIGGGAAALAVGVVWWLAAR